jgi:peroxiredoxin
MTLAVGQTAPGFRLPSAQGPDVALEDYRGRRTVIVWFTKGMACVFCRQHMTQLARLYPEIEARGAEVLQVNPSSVARARAYAGKYRLPFPYLCDTDDAVRRAWHVDVRRRGPMWYAGALVTGSRMTKPETDFGHDDPSFAEMPKLLRDDDMGFFVVDREGIVRFAYGGGYVMRTEQGMGIRPIPTNDEILKELDAARTSPRAAW